jgi:hypothetical protein
MRIFIRACSLLVPWVLFFGGIGAVFQPKSGADWVFAGHWLLIPFMPVYCIIVVVIFRLTRPPVEPPFIRELNAKRGR